MQDTHPQPILRLRQDSITKSPDGPWLSGPHLILDNESFRALDHDVANTMDDYRPIWKAEAQRSAQMLTGTCAENFVVQAVIDISPAINMKTWIIAKTHHEIATALERYYINAHMYLIPNFSVSLSLIGRFGGDWRLNARGVTGDHNLWIPSADNVDWDSPMESPRRNRARILLKHIIDNEKWTKSKYAWEADAWTDVFGQMRDDLAIAANKHEYNVTRQSHHPVTCLMDGKPAFVKRIPDATFGLATFRPEDDQCLNALHALDYIRLQALLLHRHCGLISDPHARRQACSAGAAYLDILDDLVRRPGSEGQEPGAYEAAESRSTQVLVFTSYGAHWHILVDYRRPRLAREYAGYKGMSENVYVFQRVWSGRVANERYAWELLYLVDQIHKWGVTEFRDFVIRHLKPWHEYAKKCYVSDVDIITASLNTSSNEQPVIGPGIRLKIPSQQTLPEWARWITEEHRNKLRIRAKTLLYNALIAYNPKTLQTKDSFRESFTCQLDGCGDRMMGFPLAGEDECVTHLREIHHMTLSNDERNLIKMHYAQVESPTIAQTVSQQMQSNADSILIQLEMRVPNEAGRIETANK
ncbi:hypothetical protein F5Y16DRAFT_422050 [Xylariaceae sp. FL0255]|nr:hypothetical protein F5Y16DRAFT_422050 [Xylariaceae sp. FL0255]